MNIGIHYFSSLLVVECFYILFIVHHEEREPSEEQNHLQYHIDLLSFHQPCFIQDGFNKSSKKKIAAFLMVLTFAFHYKSNAVEGEEYLPFLQHAL
jgi:hypothetical protein